MADPQVEEAESTVTTQIITTVTTNIKTVATTTVENCHDGNTATQQGTPPFREEQ